MFKKLLLIAIILTLGSSAWAQLSTTSPWPKKHCNIKNTGYTSSNTGTTAGKLKWSFPTSYKITTSPVLDANNKVYFGDTHGIFYALYRDTGTLAWKYQTDATIEDTAAAVDVNGIVYIGNFNGKIYAFDTNAINPAVPSTWVPLWVYQTQGGGAIQGSLTVDVDGSIIAPANDGYIYSLNPNGTLKWRSANNYSSNRSTPAIDAANSRILFGTLSPQDRFYLSVATAPDRIACDTINVLSYAAPTFFALRSLNGTEENFFPHFCPPGSMNSSPVINADGSYTVSFIKQTYGDFCTKNDLDTKEGNTWNVRFFSFAYDTTVDYPTDNSCITVNIPVTGGNGGTSFDGDIWATPAVMNDNSLVVAHGTTIGRYLPSGIPFNSTSTLDVGIRIESSPALDANQNVFFGTNGGIFYCFCTVCSEGANLVLWKYPADGSALKDQSGNVVEIKSSPAIDNDEKHSVYVGANNGILYAFHDGPSIKGTITRKNGDPLNGVLVTITNTDTKVVTTVLTDALGNYTSPGVDAGQYTVTPSLTNYVFNPTSAPVTITTTDQTLNFTASLSYTLTGKVVMASDQTALSQVTIALSTKNSLGVEVATASTTTDVNGNYTFTGVGYGTTTLTPSRPGYGFDPPSVSQIIDPADTTIPEGATITISNIEATLGYQVSGKVIDATRASEADNGLANVLITLSGTPSGSTSSITQTRTTDSQGTFSFTGLANGTYAVTPTRTLYKFDPTTQNAVVKDASVLNLEFQGAQGIKISGKITLSNSAASYDGFIVTLYKDDQTFWARLFNKARTVVATTTVSSTGTFVFLGIPAGNYIVEPSAEGYGFDPASEKISAITDVGGLLFAASSGYSITGRCISVLGIPQSNIDVLISGDTTAATATTGADGSYTFTGLDAGTYLVMPLTSDFYTATPLSKAVTITSSNVRKINFIIFSFCTKTYIAIPPWGTTGAAVNIIGSMFGPTPDPNSTSSVDVTMSDGTTTSQVPGVYFGTTDPNTWVQATVLSWSPFYIQAEVPLLDARLVRVWVVRPGQSACINVTSTNFFINTRP